MRAPAGVAPKKSGSAPSATMPTGHSPRRIARPLMIPPLLIVVAAMVCDAATLCDPTSSQSSTEQELCLQFDIADHTNGHSWAGTVNCPVRRNKSDFRLLSINGGMLEYRSRGKRHGSNI